MHEVADELMVCGSIPRLEAVHLFSPSCNRRLHTLVATVHLAKWSAGMNQKKWLEDFKNGEGRDRPDSGPSLAPHCLKV